MTRKIAVIDAETDPFLAGRVPEPFLWGFFDGEQYKEFEHADDLIIYLYDKNYIVYAHNGGKFDFHFLLHFIEPFTDINIINGRIAKFKIGECEFRDSYNILPTALSAFEKTPIDYAKFEKSVRHKHKKEISDYLKDDCINLYNYVSAFIDEFGLNLTVAGTALKQWKKITNAEIPNDLSGINYDKFSPYYYGGRCECFYTGVTNKPFQLIDINSAYPYAMLFNHPISISHAPINYNDWRTLPDTEKGPCFLKIRCISAGALPWRDEKNGLYFPNDNISREYNITGWELLAGMETNAIKSLEYIEGYIFNKLCNFKDYIYYYYEKRKKAKQENDVLNDIFSKLMMNALYGKFASNPENYREFQTAPFDVIDTDGKAGEYSFAGEFGNNALLSKPLDDEKMRYYNLPTSASITGFVRAYLWRALNKCEGVIYCDTDSIAAKNIDKLSYHFGNELGQWELEGKFKGGAFAGKKLYAMEYIKPFIDKDGNKITHKVASKGVKLNAKQLYKVANGATITYNPVTPTFSVHKKPVFTSRDIQITKKRLCSVG